jgi:hypothetical protein
MQEKRQPPVFAQLVVNNGIDNDAVRLNASWRGKAECARLART